MSKPVLCFVLLVGTDSPETVWQDRVQCAGLGWLWTWCQSGDDWNLCW